MNRRNLLTGLFILVALGVLALAWLSLSSRTPVPVACTDEAMVCPDGSAVGRTGPHCEFAPCPPVIATSTTPAPVACTTEAKLCPDGSSVGRIGPKCEFAQCPVPTARGISIGQSATIYGTTIGVLELVEDSRCPVDVQCIQAGTVRVRTSIDSYNRDFTFTLLQPQVVGKVTITLASVIPAQKHSTQIIGPSDYRFIFTVAPVSLCIS